METLDSGAHAYVSKEEGSDHLVEAVLAAAADRPYVTRSQARAMLSDQRPGRPELSQQELQCLSPWFQGMSKASVGRRMSISENTVRAVHISRARAKYAATGRTAPSKDALLARAIEDGVIKPGEIMPYTSFARAAANRPSPGAPGQSSDPGRPGHPVKLPPQENRPQGRRWAAPAGYCRRRHQLAGWCLVSIADLGTHGHDARSGDTRAPGPAGTFRRERGQAACQPPSAAEFEVHRAQVLPPEIVERRELALAARVVQPPDGEPAAAPVD